MSHRNVTFDSDKIPVNAGTDAPDRGINHEIKYLQETVHSLELSLKQLENKIIPILRSKSWLQDDPPKLLDVEREKAVELISDVRLRVASTRSYLASLTAAVDSIIEAVDL